MYNAISGIHKSFIGSNSYNKTGSDLYLSAGAYLTHPIPFTSRSFSDIFRLHSFIRADITSPPQKDFTDHFRTFNHRSFASFIGCGLVANICDVIKIEFNYCCPLKSESTTLSQPGFSISFSADG
ncbi:hypothetical protein MXB_5424 [Myxobolus squamalis]|nr:hypothetical protein MXB_5424 [Myxobolus squamalis]